jgi:hypothetical protein
MSISDADRDSNSIGPVEPTPPEVQQAARLTVCRNARNRDDAVLLLDMLGLRGDSEETRPSGCPVCGDPLPLEALSPKYGLRGTCSRICKQVLYPRQGAQR